MSNISKEVLRDYVREQNFKFFSAILITLHRLLVGRFCLIMVISKQQVMVKYIMAILSFTFGRRIVISKNMH